MSDEPKERKKRAISPTQRSLKHLREQGWTCAIVEKWNAHVGVRQDLFGGIDIVGLAPQVVVSRPLPKMHFGPGLAPTDAPHYTKRIGVLGIQSTTDNNVSERRAKLLALPALRLWVECGNRLVIHGWGKKGPRGARKTWTLREVELTLQDFEKAATAFADHVRSHFAPRSIPGITSDKAQDPRVIAAPEDPA